MFYPKKKSRATWYCDVDLLVIRDGAVRMIIEIEKSNVKSTQICGKFLTSALAQYYIHESENDVRIGTHDSVIFIQILDTSNLKEDKTTKFKQWENLEKSINNILPVRDSKIRKYRLFYGNQLHFETHVFIPTASNNVAAKIVKSSQSPDLNPIVSAGARKTSLTSVS